MTNFKWRENAPELLLCGYIFELFIPFVVYISQISRYHTLLKTEQGRLHAKTLMKCDNNLILFSVNNTKQASYLQIIVCMLLMTFHIVSVPCLLLILPSILNAKVTNTMQFNTNHLCSYTNITTITFLMLYHPVKA